MLKWTGSYSSTTFIKRAKAFARLHRCTYLSWPSLLAYFCDKYIFPCAGQLQIIFHAYWLSSNATPYNDVITIQYVVDNDDVDKG